jgi:hypothetical protein
MIVRKIDLKHHIDENGRIIKTGNGQVIDESEPVALFRARDWLAIPMLINYRMLCVADGCNAFQLKQIDELIERFQRFAQENPGVMKQPGVTRGL